MARLVASHTPGTAVTHRSIAVSVPVVANALGVHPSLAGTRLVAADHVVDDGLFVVLQVAPDHHTRAQRPLARLSRHRRHLGGSPFVASIIHLVGSWARGVERRARRAVPHARFFSGLGSCFAASPLSTSGSNTTISNSATAASQPQSVAPPLWVSTSPRRRQPHENRWHRVCFSGDHRLGQTWSASCWGIDPSPSGSIFSSGSSLAAASRLSPSPRYFAVRALQSNDRLT